MGVYETLWYISFATDDEFLGSAIVLGTDLESAAAAAHEQGCNPGGQALGAPLPPEESVKVPSGSIGRLLTKEDVDAIWSDCATLGEIRDEEQS